MPTVSAADVKAVLPRKLAAELADEGIEAFFESADMVVNQYDLVDDAVKKAAMIYWLAAQVVDRESGAALGMESAAFGAVRETFTVAEAQYTNTYWKKFYEIVGPVVAI